MVVPDVQTGIYSSKSGLCFAKELILRAEAEPFLGDEEKSWIMILYPLFPVSNPMVYASPSVGRGVDLATFKKHFTLVRELPAEKMQLLLPGTSIFLSEKRLERKVLGVFMKGSTALVQLGIATNQVEEIPLDEFMSKSFPSETF